MNNEVTRPTFEATEQNVMSIIKLVWEMEKITNKSKEEVIKKYSQGMCNSLSGLIQYFIPESQVAFIATFEPNGVEYRAYHFMVKLPLNDEQTHFDYYDINGKCNEADLKPYCAKMLNNVTPEEVFVGPGNYGVSKRPATSDMVINKCVELVNRNPNLISSGMLNKQTSGPKR